MGKKQKTKGPPKKIKNDPEFNQALRQMRDFVYPQMEQSAHSQYSQAKLAALGATPDKRGKANYRELQEKAKEAKREQALQAQQMRESGLDLPSLKSHADSVAQRKKAEAAIRKRKQTTSNFNLKNVGSERNGVLKVKSSVMKKTTRQKGKSKKH
eukprot:Platyproteum_vivax@DN15084_c0_g1_i1.p1